MAKFHKPVLLNEVLSFLAPKAGGIYADCTLGGGGYSEAILRQSSPDGIVIGLDRDDAALEHAAQVLSGYGDRARLVKSDFRNLAKALANLKIEMLDGVVYDLGVSGHQLESGERGFSLMQDAPLDMRMDRSQPVTAADLISRSSEKALEDLIRAYSDERWARRIAKHIVEARAKSSVRTTRWLADIVSGAIPKAAWPPGVHPATRTFQALRIAVNAEMEALEQGLKAGVEALAPGGRAVVVSYHSGEDRIVKNVFRRMSGRCECPPNLPECRCEARRQIEVLTKKPALPMPEEINENPRARSAKLRAAVRIAEDS